MLAHEERPLDAATKSGGMLPYPDQTREMVLPHFSAVETTNATKDHGERMVIETTPFAAAGRQNATKHPEKPTEVTESGTGPCDAGMVNGTSMI